MFTDGEIEYLEHQEYIAKHSKHKISIDRAYHKVYTDDENSRYFWFCFRNKKDLIETLKEYRNFKADGRTSYSLIEERYNEGV